MQKKLSRVEKIGKLAHMLGCSENTVYQSLSGKYGFGYERAQLVYETIGDSLHLWKNKGSKIKKRKLFDEWDV